MAVKRKSCTKTRYSSVRGASSGELALRGLLLACRRPLPRRRPLRPHGSLAPLGGVDRCLEGGEQIGRLLFLLARGGGDRFALLLRLDHGEQGIAIRVF